MTLAQLLTENGIKLSTPLKLNEGIVKEIPFTIEKFEFTLKVNVQSLGEIELVVDTTTSGVSSFDRSFTISTSCLDKTEKVRVRGDFAGHVDDKYNTDYIRAISILNIKLADLIDSIRADKELYQTLKDNKAAFNKALDELDEEQERKEKAEIELRQFHFEKEHSFLETKEISDILRQMRKEAMDESETISKIFSIATKEYKKSFVKVTYNSQGVLYINHSNSIRTLTDDLYKYGNKELLKNVKDRLTRSYEVSEALDFDSAF